MKRAGPDQQVRILDSFSKDCSGSLPGLEVLFVDGRGSMFAKDSNKWEVQQNKGSWSYLVPGSEYELRDGLMLRLDKKEYRVSFAPAAALDKKGAKKTQKTQKEQHPNVLPSCSYGAACYRLHNVDHCLKFSHPGPNEMNRERPKAEHNLADQVNVNWEKEYSEPDKHVKVAKAAKPFVATTPSVEDGLADGEHILAFPSISTSTFAFDSEKAMSVLVEEVDHFLKLAPANVKLVLCDLSESSVLKLARKMWLSKKGDSDRFRTAVVDLSRVNSSGPVLNATVVVNSTNKDLSPNGSGINKALYQNVPNLSALTGSLYSAPARVGEPLLVELPPNNAWRVKERVQAIIHILGPNMNPNRPDCLKDDYHRGCAQLAITYRNLFLSFLNFTRVLPERFPLLEQEPSPVKKKQKGEVKEESKTAVAAQAPQSSIMKYFNPLPTGGKKGEPATKKKEKSPSPPPPSDEKKKSSAAPAAAQHADMPKRGWAYKLQEIARAPEKHEDVVVFKNDNVVAVRDLFPKAKIHVLIMPRREIDDFSDLVPSDVAVLKEMEEVGKTLQKTLDPNKKSKFRMGYHAIPSMKQVHMHLISQDFDSDTLKHKKHWNSFTTRFFIDSKRLIAMLEDHGSVFFDKHEYEALLAVELKCCFCGLEIKTMPSLKSHIKECKMK